jgi:hypothetical protein
LATSSPLVAVRKDYVTDFLFRSPFDSPHAIAGFFFVRSKVVLYVSLIDEGFTTTDFVTTASLSHHHHHLDGASLRCLLFVSQ